MRHRWPTSEAAGQRDPCAGHCGTSDSAKERPGPTGAFYLDVISRTVNRPLHHEVLRAVLDRLSRRHPALRTRFDLGTFSEPMRPVSGPVRWCPAPTGRRAGRPARWAA
ncbi:hypothetical protein Shyhy01_38420 [Streptomyces hygroscopicus subsp. hygroscopicus]|nr:hypothetical protein [Streptomyces hygroscopicus]GLX50892.1 hypothetical protein Shyhy01_38420 [Streptomyces hygroscopicus subsp. hygroscopicus]